MEIPIKRKPLSVKYLGDSLPFLLAPCEHYAEIMSIKLGLGRFFVEVYCPVCNDTYPMSFDYLEYPKIEERIRITGVNQLLHEDLDIEEKKNTFGYEWFNEHRKEIEFAKRKLEVK